MIVIHLGKYQEIAGDEVGLQRHTDALKWGSADKREPIPDDISIANHQMGAKGELATAIALNVNNIILPWEEKRVFWEGLSGTFADPDLGDHTQVRTRRGYRSEQIVRPEAADTDYYILVTFEDRNPLTFHVIGWISVPDAKKWPLKNPRKIKPSHFIPQNALRQL